MAKRQRPDYRLVSCLIASLALFAICSRTVRAASPDAFEPDNSLSDPSPDNPTVTLATAIGAAGGPKVITPGTPQLHSLDTGGDITTADRDFVAFTLAAASDILLQADVNVGPGLINLRLFNNTGTQLQFVQNANSALSTQLTAANLAAGSYFVSTEEVGLTSPLGAQTIEAYNLTLLVNPPGKPFAPIITSPLTASGVGGAAFSYQLFAVGSGTITYTVTGLPPGIGLNGTQIIGTAQQSGTFNATVTASNGTAPDDVRTLVITINAFGIISGYAATGAVGFSGDGDIAVNALLGSQGPQGVTVDSAGNVFIADASNGRIRRVDAVTTVITTVIGSGQFTVGDGGAGTAGILNGPFQTTTDPSGNIFIADTTNNRVRRVDSVTGNITTVAGNGAAGFSGDGGTAVFATLSGPTSVAFNGGALFIADTNNSVVRKVSAGIITTVAGFVNASGKTLSGNAGDGGLATKAKLNGPTGLAFDVANNLYIADTGNNRIRMVALPTTTNITNYAGDATGGAGSTDNATSTSATFSAPRGLAFDPTTAALYVADSGNNRIRALAAATTHATSIVAGSTTSTVGGFGGDGTPAAAAATFLNFPNNIAVPSTGIVIVADTLNNRIRQFTVGGNIGTIVGNGSPAFGGDGGPAASATVTFPRGVSIAPSGNILIADTNAHRIRQIAAGNISTIAGGGLPGDGGSAASSFLNFPEGLTVSPTGNIFICDVVNRRVRLFNAATGNVSTFAGNGTNSFGGDGGPAIQASLNLPAAVALDKTGNLFIADQLNNRIRMVTPAGIISTVAGNGVAAFLGDGGPATAASLNAPGGVIVDASGNVLVAEVGNNVIRKFTPGGNISTVAGKGPKGFTGDGGPATSALLSQPRSVVIDSSGNLFIADTGNNRIRRVDALTGNITTVVGNGTASSFGDGGASNLASLNTPLSIAFDANGNLYVVDTGGRRVRRVGPASAPTITSPVMATGTQNSFFSYLITGTGNPPPTFGATGLPDGLFFFRRQISGFPEDSGATDITITASNILGSTSQTVRLIIARAPGSPDVAPAFTSPPSEITISPNPGTTNSPMSFVAPSANDTDGDLLAYDWNFGDGTTGTGATTTHTYTNTGIYTVTLSSTDGVSSISVSGQAAVNDPSVTQSAIISKAQVRLNFQKQNADLVTAAGVLPLRKGFAASGAVVKLFLGPLARTFTLNSKGGVSSKTDIFKINTSQKSGSFLDPAKEFFAGKFTVQLKSQSLAASFAALGLVKNVLNPTPIKIPIIISVNNDSYVDTLTFVYKSNGTSGTGAKLAEGASIPTR